MFGRSAEIYDAVYAFKDYAAEATRVDALIQERRPGASTLLDVACGTAKHLEHLAPRYDVEGLDLDSAILDIAAARIPPERLHVGDMETFELPRSFDAVTCLFSSVAYVRTTDRLFRAVANMARHLEPGGVLVVEPFISPEKWQASGVHAVFVDEPGLKIARINHHSPVGETVTLTFHYLVGRSAGVEHFVEEHVVALFSQDEYLGSFRAAGLAVEHDPDGLTGRGLYIGVRPRGT